MKDVRWHPKLGHVVRQEVKSRDDGYVSLFFVKHFMLVKMVVVVGFPFLHFQFLRLGWPAWTILTMTSTLTTSLRLI